MKTLKKDLNSKASATLDFEFEVIPDSGDYVVWVNQFAISVLADGNVFRYQLDIATDGDRVAHSLDGLDRLLSILERFRVGIVRCHNIGAERSVLKAWCLRHNRKMPRIVWVDTMRLARRYVPKGARLDLGSLVEAFGITWQGPAHIAINDVLATEALYAELLKCGLGERPLPDVSPEPTMAGIGGPNAAIDGKLSFPC